MDVEALFLIRSSTGWHVASWSEDLPRSELRGKYDFLGGLDSWSNFPVLVPCQTDRQTRRQIAQERERHSLHYHDEFSQYLCALLGEELAPLAEDEDWFSDIGCNKDWVWACEAAQIALRVADVLDDLIERHQDLAVPASFWDAGHYGFFAKVALQLSFGTVSLTATDITEHFVEHSDPRRGVSALELVHNHPHVLGQVLVQATGDVTGTLWTSTEPWCDDTALDDARGCTFTGINAVVVKTLPALVKSVYVRTCPCVPISVKLLSPEHVHDDALCSDWACDRKQLLALLLILRRRLPRNASHMVLQCLLPPVPALDVAVGFVHDSQTDDEQARLAAMEYDDRSKLLKPSGVKNLVDATAALKRHGCPLTIPPWVSIYGPTNL